MSSTEAELVATSHLIPQILWTDYSLKHQGFKFMNIILFQDNQSDISPQKKCPIFKFTLRRSYFSTKNRINAGDLSVKFCPLDKTIVCYQTKPLQNKKLCVFCDQILGHSELES